MSIGGAPFGGVGLTESWRRVRVHRFAYFPSSPSAPAPNLSGAILLGADGVPVRGEIKLERGAIVCDSRNPDALALSLLWPVAGCGTIQLETTRVPPRPEPYNLHTELARHRLMRISTRREEWGLFDYPGMEPIAERVDLASQRFIESIQQAGDAARAARLADESLAAAIVASEDMCRFHSNVFLSRRKNAASRNFFGVHVGPAMTKSATREKAADAFGFARVPMTWRDIQPKEQGSTYDAIDAVLKVCLREGLVPRSGPLLNFGVRFLPDWMYLWENDYEAIAEFAREHIRRTVQRYASQISSWIIASGLHVDSVFPFSFEQITELTRIAAGVTKEAAPRAQTILELVQPWGEYYARNQRSIPPLLYAEMVVQSGIAFDAFGLQLHFGLDSEGFHYRDLMQVAVLIDRLANLGKPIHLTSVAFPSDGGHGGEPGGGWTEATQAEWIAAICDLALSRPYVESLCVHTLADHPQASVVHAGMLREDGTPKPALKRLLRSRGGG